jgi:hypothetical protein
MQKRILNADKALYAAKIGKKYSLKLHYKNESEFQISIAE